MSLRIHLRHTITSLEPGSFAMVMATGIVSIGLGMLGWQGMAMALLIINVLLWSGLVCLSLARLVRAGKAMWRDLANPSRGAGYLTFAAGTLVLSSQFRLVLLCPGPALWLAVLGTLAWFALTYLFLALAMTRRHKPALHQSLNGGWLILVVSTQAVAVAITEMPGASTPLLLASWCLYVVGGFLYFMLVTLLFRRLAFEPLAANELTPPYWINMGALAITTLAGSLWISHLPAGSPLAELLPFTRALTLAFWAIASWWIPLLLLLGIWRHLLQHFPLRYETTYWNIVFPLGMYAVATHHLAQADGLGFLDLLTPAAVTTGFAAWLVTGAAGLVTAIRRHG